MNSSTGTGNSGTLVLGLWCCLVAIIILPGLYFQREIRYVVCLLAKIVTAVRKKQQTVVHPPVISKKTSSKKIKAWTEPPNTLNNSNNNKKIIWAYWHAGEEALPGFCQLAVQSWKVRNPGWQVIILSDQNYQQYVSPSDLPSTYFEATFKVQHRSDILRLAVLRRYGGLYLDASYVLLRGLDDLWDKAHQHNHFYLTSLVTLQQHREEEMAFPNNCLLLVPRPQNPVLVKWQTKMIQYMEDPCYSHDDLKRHPLFARVARHLKDPSFGALSNLAVYFSALWLLMDTIYYCQDDSLFRAYVQDHVHILPTYRWTFDFMLVELPNMSDQEIDLAVSRSENWRTWLRRIPNAVTFHTRDVPTLATRMTATVYAFKCSTDFSFDFHEPPEYHLTRNSTLARIYRAAIDTSLWPIQQATADAAYPAIKLPSSSY